VGKRGAAIIAARGVSSAASAANAAIDHMRDWALGTHGGWVTMGVPSNGEYGIPKDVMFGYPVTCAGGEYKIVDGLAIGPARGADVSRTSGQRVAARQRRGPGGGGGRHRLPLSATNRPCRIVSVIALRTAAVSPVSISRKTLARQLG
jgi:hypothetical protein